MLKLMKRKFSYKLKMWKIRGKTEVTVVAITLITLALVLYILATSDVLLDSSMGKERNSQMTTLLNKPSTGQYVNSRTISPDTLLSHNEAEERIMNNLRQDHNQDIASRVLASQKHESNAAYHSDTEDIILHQKQEHYLASHDNHNEESNSILDHQNDFSLNAQQIVHLDLKGAPPKIIYYEDLFPLLKRLGATGILLEYEDMFPYYGVLNDLAAYNAYKRSDIKHILKLAEIHGLEVIPLIQTFGHLEFVLKLETFSNLREVPKYPQVICPSHNDSIPLLTTMINQIMELHPRVKHLHIGCDEVYHLGNCERCSSAMLENKWSKSQLFLNHVIRIARFIRKNYPHVMPLTWDDEFRNLPEMELQESRVSRWLEPVVWKYSPDVTSSITSDIWEKYISVFPSVWIASAFKGATGPDKYVTDIRYHLNNHHSWMEIIHLYSRRIKFQGIMLTGWQRYDHFAVLCELLPVGLPSLAVNLAFIQGKNKGMSQLLGYVAELLKCDPSIPMRPNEGLSHCTFPGASVLSAAQRLYILQRNLDQYLSGSTVKGWFTSYNIQHGFSSPSLVERATSELDHCKMELMYIKKDMMNAMSEIFDTFTVKEWIETYIQPLDVKLQNLWDAKENLLSKNHWPRRPLDVSTGEKTSKPRFL